MNISRTQNMTNSNDIPTGICVQDKIIFNVGHCIYLGQTMAIGKKNQQLELRKMKDIFTMELPLFLKSDFYNQCILPVVKFWVLTKAIIHKLQVSQKAMERNTQESLLEIENLTQDLSYTGPGARYKRGLKLFRAKNH